MENTAKKYNFDFSNFTLETSLRAKNVWLKITGDKGLVVVIPKGFDSRRIPALIQKEKEWIKRQAERVHQQNLQYQWENSLPDKIHLQSVDEIWNVKYHKASFPEVRLYGDNAGTISLWGDVEDKRKCRLALFLWLKNKTQRRLVPILKRISQETGFSYNRVAIKGQKSIWASCSQKKNINLNFKLMMIPRRLVEYIFLHELCHTVVLNHSRRFWNLVAKWEPRYKEYNKELCSVWRSLPAWVHK
ncbi:MAG TPA: SprT family zinc-dependent metalloprotease [Candidatus Sumerlaeota bacterium]|nr:MAG: hypothetical protein BWY12_01205 [candidate division BRC1 bacterium ADurb.Bin183]HOE64034.1 SprT family zinc-dependent metalloprotease [Candidatus Sumerlaeota bacterium]HRR30400.1 SprT family zinc-dependent metalloprotease [Candidatus Sumerlaeia bacterium]HON51103.1 SprT family zinc-dependent metalloprotease [Candidatus Sumerlaeota bacterium]HOR65018.1 SprT family zinc-dependent metalloprotease [Candidatus Sumerlaeota bacterium]